jgi:hypothetical protein
MCSAIGDMNVTWHAQDRPVQRAVAVSRPGLLTACDLSR